MEPRPRIGTCVLSARVTNWLERGVYVTNACLCGQRWWVAPLSITATSGVGLVDELPAQVLLAEARTAAARARTDFSRRRTTLFREGERLPMSGTAPGTGGVCGAEPMTTDMARERRSAFAVEVAGAEPPRTRGVAEREPMSGVGRVCRARLTEAGGRETAGRRDDLERGEGEEGVEGQAKGGTGWGGEVSPCPPECAGGGGGGAGLVAST